MPMALSTGTDFSIGGMVRCGELGSIVAVLIATAFLMTDLFFLTFSPLDSFFAVFFLTAFFISIFFATFSLMTFFTIDLLAGLRELAFFFVLLTFTLFGIDNLHLIFLLN